MGYVMPKIITSATNDRARRLSIPSPSLRRVTKVFDESAERCIRPLYTTAINSEQFEYCMNILEQVSKHSEAAATHIAKCISTNIINGLTTDALGQIDLEKYDIPDKTKDLLLESLYTTATCQRILANQEKLTRRFNVDKIVKENIYNTERCIEELCSLIDTYEIPTHYKLNIALENITYTLYKNGATVNEASVLDRILEYFMMRDMNISDEEYSNYKKVLTESMMFSGTVPKADLARRVVDNSADHYISLIKKTFSESTDSYIRDILGKEAISIQTEADASNFIDDVAAYLETSNVSEDDKARLGYSIKNMHNYSPVSSQFANIKSKEVLSDADYQRLIASDCILPNSQPVVEKDIFSGIFDKSDYRNSFNEADGVASTDDIKGLINKFKAEQDKSPNKIKNFFVKLHTKSPEVIIDDLPDVMGLARGAILLALATVTPIGPIIAGVTGLISWLLSKHINDNEANRLLNSIRSEKKKIQAKIDKTSNEKKKKELETYLSNLKSCENKVVEYLDNLEDKDHSDPDDDSMDDDLDIDFECTIPNVSNLLTMVNEVMEFDANQVSLFNNIEECAKAGILSDITDLVKESSISIKDYTSLLESIYTNSKDPIVRTAITSSLGKINEGLDLSPCRSIIAADIANKALLEASYEIVQEKFSLNTVKLALQNAKAKLKELSTKEKSMWQAVDAQGSGLVKSIEKALTSDRREAIIKGSIIPSFSKCIKGAIALAGVGVLFGPMGAIIAAVGGLATSKVLNAREKKLLYDEIDTELKVVEKQLEIAQNDGDMNQYRFLLNYQKKLTREAQRIRYGLKVQGRDIPAATLPGRGGKD